MNPITRWLGTSKTSLRGYINVGELLRVFVTSAISAVIAVLTVLQLNVDKYVIQPDHAAFTVFVITFLIRILARFNQGAEVVVTTPDTTAEKTVAVVPARV